MVVRLPTFAIENKTITYTTVAQVIKLLEDITLHEVVAVARLLGCSGQSLICMDFDCTIEDIFSMYGNVCAESMTPVLWWGGPQLSGTEPFTLLTGSVKDWLLDCILYELHLDTRMKTIKSTIHKVRLQW